MSLLLGWESVANYNPSLLSARKVKLERTLVSIQTECSFWWEPEHSLYLSLPRPPLRKKLPIVVQASHHDWTTTPMLNYQMQQPGPFYECQPHTHTHTPDQHLAFNRCTFYCRVGLCAQTFQRSPQDACGATDGEEKPWWMDPGLADVPSAMHERGRKVNKQLKCQHSNVSEALAVLPLHYSENPAAKFGRQSHFSRTRLQAEAPFAPLRGHFADDFARASADTTNSIP